MRITLLTNRDLASNIALNLLLPTLSDKHEVEAFALARLARHPPTPIWQHCSSSSRPCLMIYCSR